MTASPSNAARVMLIDKREYIHMKATLCASTPHQMSSVVVSDASVISFPTRLTLLSRALEEEDFDVFLHTLAEIWTHDRRLIGRSTRCNRCGRKIRKGG